MSRSMLAVLLMFQASFVGCAFSKKPKQDDKTVVIQGLDQLDHLSEKELAIKVIETPTFNEYYVQFSWPASKQIRVELKEGDQIVSTSLQNNFQLPILGGDTKTFFITVYNSLGGNVFNKEVPVTAPKDLEITDSLSLTRNENWNFNRVYFGVNSRLNLHGFDLNLRADRINFAVGTIIETGGGSVATSDQQIKNSQIRIDTRTAIGRLEVRLDGYHGRDGKSGDDIDKANGFVDSYRPELQGTSATEGKIAGRKSDVDCRENGADGGRGKTGAKGQNGESGESGGSTGSFILKVASLKESSVAIEVLPRPGQPGKGGAGGTGRRGGQGGKASTSACGGAKGPDGPRGQTGDRGADGAPGNVGDIFVTQGIEIKVRN